MKTAPGAVSGRHRERFAEQVARRAFFSREQG